MSSKEPTVENGSIQNTNNTSSKFVMLLVLLSTLESTSAKSACQNAVGLSDVANLSFKPSPWHTSHDKVNFKKPCETLLRQATEAGDNPSVKTEVSILNQFRKEMDRKCREKAIKMRPDCIKKEGSYLNAARKKGVRNMRYG